MTRVFLFLMTAQGGQYAFALTGAGIVNVTPAS